LCGDLLGEGTFKEDEFVDSELPVYEPESATWLEAASVLH